MYIYVIRGTSAFQSLYTEIQRYRDTEEQRYSDTAYSDTEIQRYRDTKIQR